MYSPPQSLDNEAILALARQTIGTEAAAVEQLISGLDAGFAEAVRVLLQMEGRAIVTGIGKSAIIAQKIVATFNSTGTPAVFMHAADAIHGDLGIIQPGDVVVCLSKSGTTPEIKVLVPLIKMMGSKLIAIVSNVESYLAQQADFVVRATVEQEACPNNLAPTSSTTTQLVMGDALAICLLKARGFTPQDFAKYHPGGALGKRLYLRVEDVINPNVKPRVAPNSSLEEVILSISSNLLGATAVLDSDRIVGIVTDGDLRRLLQRTHSITGVVASDVMGHSPKTIEAEALAIDAFNLMERYKITQLLVTDQGRYAGMVHVHDLLREGIVG